jgi:cytochrome c oxidase subunit 2
MTAPLAQFSWPAVVAELPLWPPTGSTAARQVDLVYGALLGLAGFFILLVCFLIVFFATKYRAGVETDRGLQEGATLPVELTWIGIPFVLMMGVFAWAAMTFADARTPPLEARTLYVVGKQWMWKIEHPQGRTEINELHVPAGEPIKLVMTSQDVIHSFFVPAFRVKQDVLPGRYTTMWFQATTPGRYHLFCAEYCGAEHALMQGVVTVMKPSEYEEWLGAARSVEGPAPVSSVSAQQRLAGRSMGPLSQHGCDACHLPGSTVQAPRLDGLFGRIVQLADGSTVTADEQYLRESILDPNRLIVAGYPAPSVMPSFRAQLSERELMQIIEYIKTLETGDPEVPAP